MKVSIPTPGRTLHRSPVCPGVGVHRGSAVYLRSLLWAPAEAAAGKELLLRQDFLVSVSWGCSSTGGVGLRITLTPVTVLEARSS